MLLPLTSVRSNESVAASTCLERLSLSLVCDQPGPFAQLGFTEEDMISHCQTEMAVERVVGLVCMS